MGVILGHMVLVTGNMMTGVALVIMISACVAVWWSLVTLFSRLLSLSRWQSIKVIIKGGAAIIIIIDIWVIIIIDIGVIVIAGNLLLFRIECS